MLHDPVIFALGAVLVAGAIGVAYWYYELRKMERKAKRSRTME